MTTSGLARQRLEGGRPTFLVELRTPDGTSASEGMDRALRLAVSRLGSTGVQIELLSGFVVAEESRCLWLVGADTRAEAIAARDIAGLGNASVHAVTALPDRRRPAGPASRPQPSSHLE